MTRPFVKYSLYGLGLLGALIGVIALVRGIVWITSSEHTPGLTGAVTQVVWHEDLPGFGGYSGLIMDPNGAYLLAASDYGYLSAAQIMRSSQGQAEQITLLQHSKLTSHKGGPTIPFHGDIEGLTPLAEDQIGLAFESYTRLQILPAVQIESLPQVLDRPIPTHRWDHFETLFGNNAFEALATLPDNTMLAFLERSADPTITGGYLYDGQQWEGPHPVSVTPGFDISGADIGPDGCLYILERRYGLFSGFQFQIFRQTAQPPWYEAPRVLLYRSRPMALGNGEGLFVWQDGAQLMASIITDNGFPPLSPTRFIELPLRDQSPHGCAGQ